ncbi:MAG TPA: LamG domain-containing protein [Chitinophagaceae bacterium]|nr:LamG domain-containing protein [Chitinophagaceae bacterium]
MKKLGLAWVTILALSTGTIFMSCQKDVDISESAILDLSTRISILQHSTDSLLQITHQNIVLQQNTQISVDSIKAQLNFISLQLGIIETNMTAASSNIQEIENQLTILAQEYTSLEDLLAGILSQLTNNSASSLNIGLLAWYPFTGNALDSSGFNDNGTVVGAIPTSGRNNIPATAYSFNGSSDYIGLPSPFNQGDTLMQFTLSITFQIEYLPAQGGSFILWDKDGFWQGVSLSVLSDGSVQFHTSLPAYLYQNAVTNAHLISPGIWYNLIMEYSHNSCQFYLNGQPVTTIQNTLNQGGGLLSNTMAGYVDFGEVPGGNSNAVNQIGAGNSVSGGNTSFLAGKIDDFRLYKRILNQSEISILSIR